jgi:uncharacterized protein (TIGR00290 family)
MKQAVLNWSGGKDSALCLHKVWQAGEYEIASLLTSVNSHFNRVSMHGVRVSLLEKQAASIGLPLHQLKLPEMPSMDEYNALMQQTLGAYKERGVAYSIFGDIFLEDLKKYREEQLARLQFTGVFPLWKIPTDRLLREFINSGFKAVIVCTNARYLDRSFIGRELDETFIRDLPANVDPCGENGEYHSFVYDGPIFREPIRFRLGETIYRQYETPADASYDTGFWFIDLLGEGEMSD